MKLDALIELIKELELINSNQDIPYCGYSIKSALENMQDLIVVVSAMVFKVHQKFLKVFERSSVE